MSHCAGWRASQILWHHSYPVGPRIKPLQGTHNARSWHEIAGARVSQRCKFDKGLTRRPPQLCRGLFWRLIPHALPLFNQVLSSRGPPRNPLWLFNIICRESPGLFWARARLADEKWNFMMRKHVCGPSGQGREFHKTGYYISSLCS